MKWYDNLLVARLGQYIGRSYRWGMYTEKHKKDGRPDYKNPEYIEYRDAAIDDMEKWITYATTLTVLLNEANDYAVRNKLDEDPDAQSFVAAVGNANEMFYEWCEEIRGGIGCGRG